MKFYKYHALGNDYIVLRAKDGADKLSQEQIIRICDRHFGVGSDGVLMQYPANEQGEFPLRIFNPDGSEAEKSGNGLRIFSRCLWDQVEVSDKPFYVQTKGGRVECNVRNGGLEVTVEMGNVSFKSSDIPVKGAEREVLNEKITIDGEELVFSAATIGNPHCVVLRNTALQEECRRFGPFLEREERFPNRTNVQFMQILDRNNIRIEIWERGAGYTLASGSSASASAAIAKKLGLVDNTVTVHMQGGTLEITLDDSYAVLMTGAVTRVAEGEIFEEMFLWNAKA